MRLRTLVLIFISVTASFHAASVDEFVKLLVREDRMYALSIGLLAEKGTDISGLASAHINLYNAGKTIPITIEAVGARGELTPDSRIVFWGEFPRGISTPKNPVTRENAYVLRWDSCDPPNRYRELPKEEIDSAQPVLRTWRRTRRVERDLYLAHYQYYTGAPTDRVMWTKLMAPPRQNPKNTVHFDLPDLDTEATGEASLRILLWGTSTLDESPDHRWNVVLNGSDIGIAEWDGNTSCNFQSQVFPETVLRSKSNELIFVSLHTGKTVDAGLLDWLDVTYTARLDVGTKQLEFIAPPEHGATIQLKDIPEHSDVYSHEGLILNLDTNNHTLRIPSQLAGVTLRVASIDTMTAPERIMPRHVSALPVLDDRVEYLVIAHAAFMDALAPLIRQRESQGLRTALVDIEDLYDAFTDGMFSANAIRIFLDGLLEHSPSGPPSLKYVFLVGDASYDYFAIRAKDENFVPTWHTTLEDEIQLPDYAPTIALDDVFVYPDAGDQIPRAAVGRLPANTVETVEAYVQKVLTYESQCESQRLRALFIAAHGFEAFLDRLSREPSAGTFQSAYIHGSGVHKEDQTIPDQVTSAFGTGLDVLYFVGHGASFMWRTGPNSSKHTTDVFTSKQIPALRNAGRYPIVFAATCFSTLFDAPLHSKSYSDSGVGIHLVEASEAGAIAIIGQVSKIPVGAADLFARDMLDVLARPETIRLGDAYLYVKQYSTLRLDPYFKGIAVIGDPALHVGERFHRGGT